MACPSSVRHNCDPSLGVCPFRLEEWDARPSSRDRALAAKRGRSALPPGDYFAFAYWATIQRRFPQTSWDQFMEWETWQIAATLGMDRIEAPETELAWLEGYETASTRLPSTDRKG